MTTEAQFRETYAKLSGPLVFGPLDSPEYFALLNEWTKEGCPKSIELFLMLRGKTTDMSVMK